MKRRLFGIVFIVFVMFCLFGGFALNASAKSNKQSVKCFAKVKVEYGDTLWNIAEEYYSDDFKSMNKYIEEIKSSNLLYSDKIYAGDVLIIPYYN